MASAIWRTHSKDADLQERTAFMRNFFKVYFRKSLCQNTANRTQWLLAIKPHAVFIVKLFAEYLKEIEAQPSPQEFEMLSQLM